jgi:hypothetical protein
MTACIALAALAPGCRHRATVDRAKPLDGASPPTGAPPSKSEARTSAHAFPSLPEDLDAGMRSVAQWRRHLEREERERRLHYDRRKLAEHRKVLELLRQARHDYDTARGEAAVRAAQARFRSTRNVLEAALVSIDHWGVNSKVLPDYRNVVGVLSEPYPAARIQAIAGDEARLVNMSRELDQTLASIDDWLEEAAESEDE